MEAVTTTTAPVAKVYTSEKLTQLRADKKAAFDKLRGIEDTDSEEWLNQNLEVMKAGKLIDAEIASLKKAESDQKAQEARNAKLALNNEQLESYAAHLLIKDDKKADPEAKQAAYDRFMKAKEVVENQLLGSAPARTASPANVTGEAKGAASSEILDQHKANVAGGMTDSQSRTALEAAGHKRSTVWHTVNNYNKSLAPKA